MDWNTLDTRPPDSYIPNLGEYTPAKDFVLEWAGGDDGLAGIRSYDVYYNSNEFGRWRTILRNTTDLSTPFPAKPGLIVSFLTRAMDNAFNLEAWEDSRAVTTRFYNTHVTGNLRVSARKRQY